MPRGGVCTEGLGPPSLLAAIFDVVIYLGTQEQAFQGHSEGENSDNRGNYVELVILLRKYDEKLAHHFETYSFLWPVKLHSK